MSPVSSIIRAQVGMVYPMFELKRDAFRGIRVALEPGISEVHV